MSWLISTTGMPALADPLDQVEDLPDSRTPSAAVGSSMMTTLLPNAAARATATACRCPPDRLSTGWVMTGSW